MHGVTWSETRQAITFDDRDASIVMVCRPTRVHIVSVGRVIRDTFTNRRIINAKTVVARTLYDRNSILHVFSVETVAYPSRTGARRVPCGRGPL